jgi:hypothetical protein
MVQDLHPIRVKFSRVWSLDEGSERSAAKTNAGDANNVNS